MQDKKHKYSLQCYIQNRFEPLKHGSKGAKQPLKSGILVAKCRKLGVKKLRIDKQLERQNGAKCRLFLKNRQKERCVRQRIVGIFLLFNHYFL